jgi:RHS repeat-associated protein
MIHTDHLGTPHKMTDANQAIIWSAHYKPFGVATVTVSTITNNLRFPGQYFDAETRLNYNYFRDYNPTIGRYIESDPLGIDKGKNHLYVYVKSNPSNLIDSTGLEGANYTGWEAQFIIGYGVTTVSCCDGKKIHHITYRKICYGAGFTAGFSLGTAGGSQGASCSNPPTYVITTEFGVPLFGPFGGEGGGAFSPGGAAGYGGVTFGIGGKATVCYYWLVSNTDQGCCSL